MKEMNLNKEILALRNHQIQNPHVLVFDFTSLHNSGDNQYPELSG